MGTVDCPPVSVCGARRMSSAPERHRPSPTAAHAAPSLDPPQAALGLAANPNTEVKHMYGSVVAGRLAVKIGNANTKPPQKCGGFSLL